MEGKVVSSRLFLTVDWLTLSLGGYVDSDDNTGFSWFIHFIEHTRSGMVNFHVLKCRFSEQRMWFKVIHIQIPTQALHNLGYHLLSAQAIHKEVVMVVKLRKIVSPRNMPSLSDKSWHIHAKKEIICILSHKLVLFRDVLL